MKIVWIHGLLVGGGVWGEKKMGMGREGPGSEVGSWTPERLYPEQMWLLCSAVNIILGNVVQYFAK